MAAPQIIAKIAMALANTDTGKKATKGILIAALAPLALIIALIVVALGGGASHNGNAVDLAFNNERLPDGTPPEYVQEINDIRSDFAGLDDAYGSLSGDMEDGEVDMLRVKSMYFSIYFGNNERSSIGADRFVKCFVREEQREREVETEDEDGNTITETETYTVFIPITSTQEIYANVQSATGITLSGEEIGNNSEIYFRIAYGADVPTYGTEFVSWMDSLPLSNEPFVGLDGFVAPLGGEWRNYVTSEFGPRDFAPDPFHTGLDLAAPAGTPIYAVLDGTVLFVRYSNTGYGYHLAVDHGGGFVTMYCHASKILISQGDEILAGDVIAEVGTTGLSSGNHLHFEIREEGVQKNPRPYLP